MGLTKTQQKELAKGYFVDQNLSIRASALRSGVTEKTLSKWATEENWHKLKVSLVTTKQNQISFWYDQLDELKNEIQNRDVKRANKTEIYFITMLTSAIQKLEVETNVGQVIDVARKFIDFVSHEDLKLAKDVTRLFDLFIQTQSKK